MVWFCLYTCLGFLENWLRHFPLKFQNVLKEFAEVFRLNMIRHKTKHYRR
jgi:hypothetical protein